MKLKSYKNLKRRTADQFKTLGLKTWEPKGEHSKKTQWS